MNHRLIGRCAAVLALSTTLALPPSVLAHEHRTLGNGKYEAAVGWESEPAVAGDRNSASIRVTRTTDKQPVEGLDRTLHLEIRQGSQSRAFALEAVPGKKGLYAAEIIPTRAGDYQWTFTGTVDGTPVNEVFDTADGKLEGVEARASLEFPVALGDPADQAQHQAVLGQELATVRGVALAGLLVGVLALVGLIATTLLPRRRTVRDPAPQHD